MPSVPQLGVIFVGLVRCVCEQLLLYTVCHWGNSCLDAFITQDCANQNSPPSGLESVPACGTMLILWQSPSGTLIVFETGHCGLYILTLCANYKHCCHLPFINCGQTGRLGIKWERYFSTTDLRHILLKDT